MINLTLALLALSLVALIIWGLWTFNPLSGIEGYVKISTTAYAFSKWSAEMKCNLVKANNFTGAGYQQLVPGLTSATITLEQLSYDQGNSAFVCGNAYTFILGFTTGVDLSITVLVETISPAVDYEGAQSIKIVGQSNGSFTAAIT